MSKLLMTREEMRLALIVFTGQMGSPEAGMAIINHVGRDYLAGINRGDDLITEDHVNAVMEALTPLLKETR